MSAPLSLEYSRRPDGGCVLRVGGEIDRSNSAEFGSAVETCLGRTDGRLTVDLSLVDYLDSAGLSVLFAHAGQIELIVSELLAPVLEVTGLGALTPVRYPPSDRD